MRSNDEIIELLDNLKVEKNLSISEIARRVGMAKSGVSRYLNKSREFPLNRVNDFAKAFNVTPEYILGIEKKNNKLQIIYDQLHPNRQHKVLDFARHQLDEQKGNYYTLICNGAVSAGTGEWLEDEVKEEITISADKVPSSPYDLVLRVNGDSMEPLFQNHEYIFVRNTTEIRNGQIGVFIVDNEAYLKKAYIEKDHLRLVSLNKAYDDLVFDDKNEIKAVGVVVM